MGNEPVRYAIGEFGKLHKFTGKDVPTDTVPLVEEDGKSLTEKGKTYASRISPDAPNVEIIRVLFEQYSASAVGEAIEAHDRTLTKIPEIQEKTKIMSERLKEDWMAQDKAYQESIKARNAPPPKKAPAPTK